jgi:hypothetical protein
LKPVEVAPPPVNAVAQAKVQASVLDHFGYRGFKLGMSRDTRTSVTLSAGIFRGRATECRRQNGARSRMGNGRRRMALR